MNILIVSQYYYPEQFQINEIAPELVRRGHDVTVLTGTPNYPEGVIYPGYEHGERSVEVLDGVRVVRVKERPRGKGAIDLIRNYRSFVKNAAKMANRLSGDNDIVLCYQLSPVTVIRPAAVYAAKYRKPLFAYCLDIWPESAKDHMNIPFVYGYIRRLSKKMYRQCDRIGVTSRPFIDYLSKKNKVKEDRLIYIPQHADGAMCDMDLSAEDNGVADFLYAGNFGKGQRVEVILRAAALLKDREDFTVHLVGDGSRRQELEALCKELGIEDKVIFYGNKPRSEMPEYYKKADALLLTLRGNNAVGDTMPGKLQMYMTAGKPIFGSINGAAAEVIDEANCGRCVPAEDPEGLAALMKDYIEHPEAYADCGKNGRAYFKKNFTLSIFVDRLEEQLKGLAEHDF